MSTPNVFEYNGDQEDDNEDNSSYNVWDDSLIGVIRENMDGESEPEKLRDIYSEANEEVRDAIDNVFVALTGWTFPSLLEKTEFPEINYE